jgi:hypothetical protein
MPQTMTTNRGRHSRWAVRILTLGVGLAMTGCGAGGTGDSLKASSVVPAASPTPPGVTISALTKIMEQAARDDGDPGVLVAYVVLTTRQAAVTLISGDGIPTNEPVYLVQMLGHFTLTGASFPAGGHPPTGTALSFDVDVSDDEAVDTALTEKAADLSTLGPVFLLNLSGS